MPVASPKLVAEGRKHRTVCREAVFRAAAEGIAGRGIAAFSDMSVTDKGVTVTLKQSIVNGAWGYVSFLRSGSSHYTFRKPGKHPITIPKHEPIKRIYVEMVRKVVEEESANEND